LTREECAVEANDKWMNKDHTGLVVGVIRLDQYNMMKVLLLKNSHEL